MTLGYPLPDQALETGCAGDVSGLAARIQEQRDTGEEPMRPAPPQRVQLRRTKGWRMPANTLKVDRTTRFGNPFLVSDYGRPRAIGWFRAWLSQEGGRIRLPPGPALARRRREILEALPSLRGRNLACWCPLPEAGEPDQCHGAVLLDLANR